MDGSADISSYRQIENFCGINANVDLKRTCINDERS